MTTITPLQLQALTMLYKGRQLPALTVRAVSSYLIDEGLAQLEHTGLGEVLTITDAGRAAVEAVRDREIDKQPVPVALSDAQRAALRLPDTLISMFLVGLVIIFAGAFGIGLQLNLLRDAVQKNAAANAEALVEVNARIEALRLAVKVNAEPRALPEPVPVVSSRETGPEDLIPLLPLPRR